MRCHEDGPGFLPSSSTPPPAHPLDPQPLRLQAERLAAGFDCITLWRTTRESFRILALPPHWLPQLRRLPRLGKAAIKFEANLKETVHNPIPTLSIFTQVVSISLYFRTNTKPPRGRHWRRGRKFLEAVLRPLPCANSPPTSQEFRASRAG